MALILAPRDRHSYVPVVYVIYASDIRHFLPVMYVRIHAYTSDVRTESSLCLLKLEICVLKLEIYVLKLEAHSVALLLAPPDGYSYATVVYVIYTSDMRACTRIHQWYTYWYTY